MSHKQCSGPTVRNTGFVSDYWHSSLCLASYVLCGLGHGFSVSHFPLFTKDNSSPHLKGGSIGCQDSVNVGYNYYIDYIYYNYYIDIKYYNIIIIMKPSSTTALKTGGN